MKTKGRRKLAAANNETVATPVKVAAEEEVAGEAGDIGDLDDLEEDAGEESGKGNKKKK